MKKSIAISLFLVLVIFICSGCQQQEERTYTDAEVQKNMENATELWNGGNLAIVDELYSDDCIYHNADLGDANGPAEIKEYVKSIYSVYSDFAITLGEPMKLKDRVVLTFEGTGTNDGALGENKPPTGKKMSFTGVSIIKIENGKITEEWVYYNQMPIFKMLGYKLVLDEEAQM